MILRKGGSDHYRFMGRSQIRMLALNLRAQALDLHAAGVPIGRIARMLHRHERYITRLLKPTPQNDRGRAGDCQEVSQDQTRPLRISDL